MIFETAPLSQPLVSSLIEVVVEVRPNHVLNPHPKNLQRNHQRKLSSSKRRQAKHPKNEGSQYSCQKPTGKRKSRYQSFSNIDFHRFSRYLHDHYKRLVPTEPMISCRKPLLRRQHQKGKRKNTRVRWSTWPPVWRNWRKELVCIRGRRGSSSSGVWQL